MTALRVINCHKSILVLGLVLLDSSLGLSQTIVGEVTTVGDAAHLEFKGLKNWPYSVVRKGKNIQLTVPAFDQKTLLDIKTWAHPFFSKVTIDTNGPDNSYVINFSVKNESIESFDYLTDQPSRLILDFYIDSEKQKKIVQKRKAKSLNKKTVRQVKIKKDRSKYTKLNSQSRAPAGSELLTVDKGDGGTVGKTTKATIHFQSGLYDSGDPNYNRFRIKKYQIKEESIIASQQNIYIRFPMLKMTSSQLGQILESPPEYIIKPKETSENKQARFLLTLFEKNRNAVFLKTYKFFKNKYPNSKYMQIIKHMAADTNYRMWKKNKKEYFYKKSMNLYAGLLKKYPNSPLAERTKLIMAYTELERGRSLSSIQNFNQFVEAFPNSDELDRARFAIAESFLLINKFNSALEIYEDLTKNHKDPLSSVEADYRKGDIFFQKGEYKKAIDHYRNAISKHKSFESLYPNANYNMGESHFWTGEYYKGLQKYIRFIQLFPNHEHNPFALTRIGEILEILGADPTMYMGAYMESFFRYQNADGAHVARIRMLSKQMKGMRDKELRRTLREMNKLGESEVLQKNEEFVTLMITDGFRYKKDYDMALKYLVKYYQKNPTSANLSLFRKRIVDNITDSINDKINDDDFIAALRLYDTYRQTWLQNITRYDIPYFLGRAYELANVFDEAQKIYESTYKKINKISGTREEVERKVREYLPSVQTLNLRLAAVMTYQRKYAKAFKYLGKINNPKKLSHKEQVERVKIAAIVYEERGLIKKSIEHLKTLIADWEGKEQLLSGVHLKLASLYMKKKQFTNAEVSSQQVIDLHETSNGKLGLSDDELSSALKIKGDAILAQGRKMESVSIYLSLLDKFEENQELDYIRYKAGHIIFNQGDLKGAEKVWMGLEGKKNKFYLQLAKEKIESAKWRDSYSKYIDRIPAKSR